MSLWLQGLIALACIAALAAVGYYFWTDYQRREEEARLQRCKEHVALLASGLEVARNAGRSGPSGTWLASQIETCVRFRLR